MPVVDIARLEANLTAVRCRMNEAAERAGRPADAVTLVAVTKTVSADVVRALHDLGVRDFGENRSQIGVPKVAECGFDDVVWHFIGHLQRNKARDVFPAFGTLHSLDSLRLARQVQTVTAAGDFSVRVLVEVKTSAEEAKLGVSPDAVKALLTELRTLPNPELRGLMTMAPWVADAEEARGYFAALRELRDRMEEELALPLPELSMGMSNDFEVAIEEGATLVRVGSALFEGMDLE